MIAPALIELFNAGAFVTRLHGEISRRLAASRNTDSGIAYALKLSGPSKRTESHPTLLISMHSSYPLRLEHNRPNIKSKKTQSEADASRSLRAGI